MLKTTFLAAAAATLFLAGGANALTLTNRDVVEQMVNIIEGDVTERVMVGPGETLDQICPEGCTLSLGDGAEESFAGDEIVYIQDGGFVVQE